MGAWIETAYNRFLGSREKVAPYVGAWIETSRLHIWLLPGSVAPYVGAWIETGSRLRSRENDKSHPTWVRGLKLYLCQYSYDSCFVAPYVGAWIETRYSRKAAARFFVAPYVGAWIETSWY